jgi:hypothetical protein
MVIALPAAAPSMHAKAHKLLLVNLTWAVVALAGLAGLYVGSYGLIFWLNGRGVLTDNTTDQLALTVYMPLEQWSFSSYPGAETLYVLGSWSYWQGQGQPFTWREIAAGYRATQAHDMSHSF